MIIGGKDFDFDNHFYMMGILNVTPDSFSDGGRFNEMDKALFHVARMLEDGADIIDVGGESTRPGHVKISEDEEIERVCPVIEKIKERFDVPVSLDTYKASVADAGIEAGADFINDIWGLKWDEGEMASVIANAKVPCGLMHNRHVIYVNRFGKKDDKDNADKKDVGYNYVNLMDDVLADLNESIDIALNAGIDKENIILDPGIGFAKDLDQNLTVMNNLEKLCKLGYPVLLGTSRKSMIGLALKLPVDQRLEGTIATSVLGYQAGCRMFRVHDVKENRRAIMMAEAIMRQG